jgi:hypothetical protein
LPPFSRLARLVWLTVLLWVASLVLAAPIVATFWRWAYGATASRPEADRLLHGLNLATVAELTRADYGSVLTALSGGIGAMVLLAVVAGPLLTAIVLLGLRAPMPAGEPTRPAAQGFGAAMLLGLVSRVIAIGFGLLAGVVVSAIVTELAGDATESGPVVGIVAGLAVGVPVWWWISTAGDLGMAATIASVQGRATRSFLRGLGLAVRSPVQLVGLWIVRLAVPAAVVQAIYAALPDDILALPFVLIASQQFVMLARSGFRVSLLAALMDWVEHEREMSPPLMPATVVSDLPVDVSEQPSLPLEVATSAQTEARGEGL